MPWWRREPQRGRPRRRPVRQYWARAPSPTDALSAYPRGGLGLVDKEIPGEIFPDEVDPAWADPDQSSEDNQNSHDAEESGQVP
jgi:hypothetical protein